ncbi:MAG: UvrD-helicase domain-containing protein [Tannerella sp.]|jgi:DNA helicase-2/ATP-dependent DNA helicase PcrA|nr:UvrD-helicase domain-containing protein [Tannerella sp.]
METKKSYLDQLNESQREAVIYSDGAALVVAGAGSGKTRVLTYKIAYLIQQGFSPYNILALTFTNKSAREMKSRIGTITDEYMAQRLWMGTFHSIFYRILRYEAERIGYPSDFTIYDTTDSKSLIRSIIKEMQLDDKIYRPGMIQSRISNAKNALITSSAYDQHKELIEYDLKSKVPLLREIYKRYQARCFQAGAMDFDELLLQTNILFRDHPDILAKYQDKFQYVLVDEYQDTNFAQHLIVTRLCEKHHRICVVGDDAQSIYSFRGANIDNMLRFKDNYPECRIFKLEQNYRSTQNIVNAANSLILKNKGQIPKTVYSENEMGNKIGIFSSYSDYEEGYLVASQILERKIRDKSSYSDFAVLYRTNAQSRVLEEALRKRNITYKVYGSQSFYQRKEVKDIIAYFRMVINPNDEESLKRIINYPVRGIGNTTVNKLLMAATAHQKSVWAVLSSPIDYGVQINGGTAKKLQDFRIMMEELIAENTRLSAIEMAELIVKRSGMAAALFQDRSVEGISRQENMQEVLKAITEFTEIRLEEGTEHVSLSDFLIEVSLITDQDNDKDEQADKVTLMTVHAAKGLEFDNVFIVGMEEELFPSSMVTNSIQGIEEERRLFYVAITRARKNCTITYAKSRFKNGQSKSCIPSHFLGDLDPQYLEQPEELTREKQFSENRTYNQKYTTSSFPSQKEETISQKSSLKKLVSNEYQDNKQVTVLGEFQVGDTVRHNRFGEGKITSLEGSGGDAKAIISFEHLGQKNLLLKYAKLTILKKAAND